MCRAGATAGAYQAASDDLLAYTGLSIDARQIQRMIEKMGPRMADCEHRLAKRGLKRRFCSRRVMERGSAPSLCLRKRTPAEACSAGYFLSFSECEIKRRRERLPELPSGQERVCVLEKMRHRFGGKFSSKRLPALLWSAASGGLPTEAPRWPRSGHERSGGGLPG